MIQRMKKTAVLVVSLALILGFLYWKFGGDILQKRVVDEGIINLNYWGFEDERVIKEVLQNYQSKNPKIKIVYTPQNLLNYRTRVQTQMRNGVGPDIFELHNSWVGMFLPDLEAAPKEIFSEGEFKKSFYPVAVASLIVNENVLAVPVALDGLVMFYNEDILKAAGILVPQNWQELINAATTVTVKNQQGSIQTAGAAMGATSNIDYWPEILGLLFVQQPKVNLASPDTAEGAEVLKFYTSFVIDPKLKTWDSTLSSSTQQFIEGKLAFYFAPASQIGVIKSQNPNLNFKTAPVPQLPGKKSAWGSFWALGVSKYSAKTDDAWRFLKYLTSGEVQKEIYDQKTQLGLGVFPFARVSLGKEQIDDSTLGAFIKQGPYYKNWYLNYKTGDAGINDEEIALFEKAVNGVLGGQDPQGALAGIQNQVGQVVERYTSQGQGVK